jgi:hypothetical protein
MAPTFTPTFTNVTGFTGAPASSYAIYEDIEDGHYRITAYFKAVPTSAVLGTAYSFKTAYLFSPDSGTPCVKISCDLVLFNSGGTVIGTNHAVGTPIGTISDTTNLTVAFSGLSLLPDHADITLEYVYKSYN